ncbi:MAG: sulfur oxidation c-type cytochrome SoxX [Pseudomonadota bacterium]
MKKFVLAFAAVIIVSPALAQQAPAVDQAKVDAAIKAAFPTAPADWAPRLTPDETMRQCSAAENLPAPKVGEEIQKRERATIEYPPDGKLVGDWKKGETLAQSGFGLRFTDYPPGNRVNGGNCYACHQLTKAEVSYGTVGPSLYNYGKIRNYSEADTKGVYEKIYNPHAAYPCSLMPRFGSNKVLTIEQIKDAVALLMSPDSPVNK